MTPEPQWVYLVAVSLIRAKKWTKRDWPTWWRWLPYRLHATDRADVFCVVNRHYKCIGGERTAWDNYEAAEGFHVPSKVFERMREASIICDRGYLYKDATAPWHSRENFEQYQEKVERLLRAVAPRN